jgi:hypothetical protein
LDASVCISNAEPPLASSGPPRRAELTVPTLAATTPETYVVVRMVVVDVDAAGSSVQRKKYYSVRTEDLVSLHGEAEMEEL